MPRQPVGPLHEIVLRHEGGHDADAVRDNRALLITVVAERAAMYSSVVTARPSSGAKSLRR